MIFYKNNHYFAADFNKNKPNLNYQSMKIWGVDLGGTKIECAVLDHNNHENVLIRKRIPTEADKGYRHIVGQIVKLIDLVADELGEKPEKIGFATPGVLDPGTQTMKNSNSTALNGQPLERDLSEALGVPVKLANDANCFALAEKMMGAGKVHPNAEVVFGVIMGTGVGGGLVVGDRIIGGHHGIGGEWGHNELEFDGDDCYCGKKGCTEQVISGPALERYYARVSGEKRSLKDILARSEDNSDAFATETIDRLLEFYGKGISSLINVIDPDLIVIGGGVGNIDCLYTDGYERIKKYIFNKGIVSTPVVKPVLGDSAGVFGAALLFS
jgi:fructokinase